MSARNSIAYRTGAVYAVLFVALAAYFGFYKRESPGLSVIGIALLFGVAGGLKIWLLSYVSRRTDEAWVAKAFDLALDVLFLVIVIIVFVSIGKTV